MGFAVNVARSAPDLHCLCGHCDVLPKKFDKPSIATEKSFCNSKGVRILCFAEKEMFAVNTAYDGLLHELQKQGAYLLNKAQTEQLVNIVLQPKKGGGHEVNKKWVHLLLHRH